MSPNISLKSRIERNFFFDTVIFYRFAVIFIAIRLDTRRFYGDFHETSNYLTGAKKRHILRCTALICISENNADQSAASLVDDSG